MTSRKTFFGLAMICTMAVAGISAAGAGATAAQFDTCVDAPGLGTTNAKCDPGSKGNYFKAEFNPKDQTIFKGIKPPPAPAHKLKATVAGVSLELTATEVEASGELEDIETGGVMEGTGTGTIEYLHATANHECKVNGAASSTITTSLLHTHTLSTTELKFEPNPGTKIMEFTTSG